MRANSLRPQRRLTAIATAALTVVLGLTTGCGTPDDDTPVAAGPVAATPADEPAPAAGDDCGDALNEIKATLIVMSDVTSVEVPSCAEAVVHTTLDAGQGDLAASICQNAASASSTHGVAAVRVVSADGKKLATGTTTVDCAATAG
jgi:hypothetical protein